MASEWRMNVMDLGYQGYIPGFASPTSLIARLVTPVGPYLYLCGVVARNRMWLLGSLTPVGPIAPFDLGVPPAATPHFPYGIPVVGN